MTVALACPLPSLELRRLYDVDAARAEAGVLRLARELLEEGLIEPDAELRGWEPSSGR